MIDLTGGAFERFKSTAIGSLDFCFPDFSNPVFENCIIVPGFVDVHVHLREPGFSYKETIRTGTLAAAHGGYSHVMTMPNLSPVPDSLEHLEEQLGIIARDAVIRVTPYGSITVGEKGDRLSDMSALAPFVCGFSDDGRGVQDDGMMLLAMTEAKRLGKPIAAHCEVNSLLDGGYIHKGDYARKHGHRGICSESEWKQIERDLALASQTGCSYHVCHISTAESVELIRRAKKAGVDVTCETAPHYLCFTDNDLLENGCFKMNPPLRSERDREALIEGVADGTIDMIATDHAPHSAEEKSRGLEKSAFGIVGLETAFPVVYTKLVKTGVITLERLIGMMCTAPRKRFGLDTGDDFAVMDIGRMYRIDDADFLSKGKASPFIGMQVFGKCLVNVCRGKIVYTDPSVCS